MRKTWPVSEDPIMVPGTGSILHTEFFSIKYRKINSWD
jgi:hypothetical protein